MMGPGPSDDPAKRLAQPVRPLQLTTGPRDYRPPRIGEPRRRSTRTKAGPIRISGGRVSRPARPASRCRGRRMNLSEALFEQIVSSLAAGGSETLPSITLETNEQRRGARFTAEAGTTI